MFSALNRLITEVNMIANEKIEKDKEEDLKKMIDRESKNPNSVFYTGDCEN